MEVGTIMWHPETNQSAACAQKWRESRVGGGREYMLVRENH